MLHNLIIFSYFFILKNSSDMKRLLDVVRPEVAFRNYGPPASPQNDLVWMTPPAPCTGLDLSIDHSTDDTVDPALTGNLTPPTSPWLNAQNRRLMSSSSSPLFDDNYSLEAQPIPYLHEM